MEIEAKCHTERSLENGSEGWVSIKFFKALYEKNRGVRARLTDEYFNIFVDAGVFEIDALSLNFRVISTVKDWEEKKKTAIQSEAPAS